MSVVINGMEMPINCTRCPCSDDETRFCNAAKKYIPMYGKPEFCPLATIEERKTGKWRPFGLGDWQCSECNAYVYDVTPYCPNCGARMDESSPMERINAPIMPTRRG